MNTTVTVGKRLIPLEQIVLAEPFDPEAPSNLQTERVFKTRLVLMDRDSVLIEEDLLAFAERHAFRSVEKDGIAVNPSISFIVEVFSPSPGFEPKKPYRSRLVWRALNGERQSKLLLTEPDDALSITVRGESSPTFSSAPSPKAVKRRRRRSRAHPSERALLLTPPAFAGVPDPHASLQVK